MSTINGLPAHIMLVHAVVVLVPLSALALVAVACWPAARRRYAVITAALAAITLVMVPITTEAGDWLEHHLPRTPLLRIHTRLGDSMLPWAIGLFLVAVVIAGRELWMNRRSPAGGLKGGPGTARADNRSRARLGGRPLTVILAALALVVAIGSVITVYRIGDSGARAAWTGQFSATPVATQPHPAANANPSQAPTG